MSALRFLARSNRRFTDNQQLALDRRDRSGIFTAAIGIHSRPELVKAFGDASAPTILVRRRCTV